jgi:membrane protease YdiL (CAAX protease family)
VHSRRTLAIVIGVSVVVSTVIFFLIDSHRLSPSAFPMLFALGLLAGLPALSYWSGVRIRRQSIPSPSRLKVYRSLVISDWALAIAAFCLFDTQGLPGQFLGFWWVGLGPFFAWTLAVLAGCFLVLWVALWLINRGWLPPERESDRLVPETRTERIVCVFLLAPTIGFCEEVLYRGYLLLELPQWLGRYGTTWALGLSAVAFGFLHASRGRSIVLTTALMGVLLSCPLIYSGSLYPSIVAHAVYDAVVLVWLGPRSSRQRRVSHLTSSALHRPVRDSVALPSDSPSPLSGKQP